MEAARAICVVIPVYNGRKYLSNCIESVLNQTFDDFSLVLVGDGSTDGSGQICDAYAAKDARIRVIHQPNKGSVLARKAGVLSEYAQAAKYLFLADADDILRPNALELLYREAENNELDCVCAAMTRMWKNIPFPSRHHSPCFDEPKVYTHDEIIKELYISCFGISNYPVNLFAKLYRTELITRVIDFPPVVRFMGEDLSVTLRLMPETERLGIIQDVVYNYRIGGNTSRFMPYMLDDFLSLYRFKTKQRLEHPMPQDAEYYMAVELMNVLVTWFSMYKQQGKHTKAELTEEIARTATLPEVADALNVLRDRGKQHFLSVFLENREYEKITEIIMKKLKKDASWRILKQILYSL